MILKQNSISAKVYRNFYETSRMPQSLCLYFWKLVFAWPITIIFTPLLIPFLIVDKIKGDSGRVPFLTQAFLSILIYGAVFCIFCLGVTVSSIWITYYQGTSWYGWYISGIIVICSLLVVGVILLIREIKLKLRIRRTRSRYVENGNYLPFEEPKPNILVEFIKAKYNKYCPKIDWQ